MTRTDEQKQQQQLQLHNNNKTIPTTTRITKTTTTTIKKKKKHKEDTTNETRCDDVVVQLGKETRTTAAITTTQTVYNERTKERIISSNMIESNLVDLTDNVTKEILGSKDTAETNGKLSIKLAIYKLISAVKRQKNKKSIFTVI